MRTTAARLHGTMDIRLDQIDLPPLQPSEILARVVTNSLCMSDYKAAVQGTVHKRVPKDIAQRPIIIGHEFCGEIVEVGSLWSDLYSRGDRFAIQPALNLPDSMETIGYSFSCLGGNATYVIIPELVIRLGCVLPYDGPGFFLGSLAEPVSCVAGAFHAMFHTTKGSYRHRMGIAEGGSLAILAGAGPMGLIAIDWALHAEHTSSMIVVTDIDGSRLRQARACFPPEQAAREGISLVFIDPNDIADPVGHLREISGGRGFDDVFVMKDVRQLVEQADAILAFDGCLNFFAGPERSDFRACVNFHAVHYGATHVVGTSGGNTDDMREALRLMEEGVINPSVMVTHIGGLQAVPDAVASLPDIPGGKKLIYTHLDFPLIALEDLELHGGGNPLFAQLSQIVFSHGGLWCVEAERYLLEHAPRIDDV